MLLYEEAMKQSRRLNFEQHDRIVYLRGLIQKLLLSHLCSASTFHISPYEQSLFRQDEIVFVRGSLLGIIYPCRPSYFLSAPNFSNEIHSSSVRKRRPEIVFLPQIIAKSACLLFPFIPALSLRARLLLTA